MMRVLVTGGAGYVGSVLIPELLNRGFYVRCVDRLMYGGRGLLPCFIYPNFEFVRGDVLDPQLMAGALSDMDAVIHLAAIVGFPACNRDADLARKINLDGTVLVDQTRRPDQPLIYASTGSNYGAVVGQLCTEDTPLSPLTVYGETKTQAERHVMASGNATAFRFATAFGVSNRMRLDLLINDFVRQAVKDRNLIVYERTFKRTFIHVRDMARAFIFALENWDRVRDEVFNVGDERNNYSKADVAELLHTKLEFYLHYAEIGTDQDKRNYEVSYEKLRQLGFECQITVEDGVDELIRAFGVLDPTNTEFTNV